MTCGIRFSHFLDYMVKKTARRLGFYDVSMPNPTGQMSQVHACVPERILLQIRLERFSFMNAHMGAAFTLIENLVLTNGGITIFRKNAAVFAALLPACRALERGTVMGNAALHTGRYLKEMMRKPFTLQVKSKKKLTYRQNRMRGGGGERNA